MRAGISVTTKVLRNAERETFKVQGNGNDKTEARWEELTEVSRLTV